MLPSSSISRSVLASRSSGCSAFSRILYNNILGKRLELCRVNNDNVRHSFFERNRKGRTYRQEPLPYSLTELALESMKVFVDETKMFISECKENLHMDPKIYKHGDTEVVFRFDSEDCLKQWKTAADSSYKEGKSECKLEVNNYGKGVFSGVIDLSTPKDGKTKRTGYCTMRSKNLMKSFRRPDSYLWAPFSHLEMRVRGDGRAYNILLGLNAYYDVQWLDIYTYGLYTHGGPYWQTVRIPFSKFYLTSKGRIQDKQRAVAKMKINSVGFTVAKTPGPFRLEIDYIGVHRDLVETEKFAYEMYNIPKYIVSV